MRVRAKLGHLDFVQMPSDFRPGFFTSVFRNALDQKRQHTYFHVRFDSAVKPVVHRGHFDARPLEGSEAALDDHQAFVAASRVLQSNRVVVGLQHPLAVVSSGFSYLGFVDSDFFVFGYRKVSFEAFRRQQFDSPLGRRVSILVLRQKPATTSGN